MNSVIHLKIAKDKIEKKVCTCNQKSLVSHISTKQLILLIVPGITNFSIKNRLSKLIVSLIIARVCIASLGDFTL